VRDSPTLPRELFLRAQERLAASRVPDLLLLLPPREALSGPVLAAGIGRTARFLSEAGIQGGSRVLLVLSDPLAWIFLLPALWGLDCIPSGRRHHLRSRNR